MSRDIVKKALNERMVSELWSSSYLPALPFQIQDFRLGAVLTGVFYLLRWGHRRGKGTFRERFGIDDRRPTASSVAAKLASDANRFQNWDSETAQAILSDLLLAYVFDTKGRAAGRDVELQRIFPTHYLASWVDLPEAFANLRAVPEAIVALLANNGTGKEVTPEGCDARFPVGQGIAGNLLLELFDTGVTVGDPRSLTSDQFSEDADIGLDQLLTVRIAQSCGGAPGRPTGRNNPSAIPNQHPIATVATTVLRDDLVTFLRAYGDKIPRSALLPMLESALSLGIVNLYLSSVRMLERWAEEYHLPEPAEQQPWPLFTDCSSGVDLELRRISEQSVGNCRQRLEHAATILMLLRLLDFQVEASDIPSKERPLRRPDATAWINLLGDVLAGTHSEAKDITRVISRDCKQLKQALEESGEQTAAAVLGDESDTRNPTWRMAEALTPLMGSRPRENAAEFFRHAALTDEPNGMSSSRRGQVRTATGRTRTMYLYSAVLSDTMLDYLVHRHVRSNGKGTKPKDLSLPQFVALLRERYGLFVDQAPPDVAISSELLARNRRFLERRLRDLGLLVGVNDAESMKRLRQRFDAVGDMEV